MNLIPEDEFSEIFSGAQAIAPHGKLIA